MKIILIRHLPTPGNEKHQYIGTTDENLSRGAVERFRQENRIYPQAEYIIASPMKRCLETAQLIYPNREIRVEPGLRECAFGEFEGKTYEELKNHPAYVMWLESGGMTAFPGGESQEKFRTRCVESIKKWIRLLLKGHAQSAAFVVHGGTIMAVMEKLSEEQMEFYHWQVENGGGYEAEVQEEDWAEHREILRRITKLEKRNHL